MTLDDDTLWGWAGTVLVVLGTIVLAGIKMALNKLESHDTRIAVLERDTVHKEQHNRDISEIYTKIDNGFSHVGQRLDGLFNLLIDKLPK
ncbi:hypothetical protein [Methylovulum miyakonense]|uniref:hypothetical protein n=1 Tax=Methylovulum miyakonense TaxID=645578 RepID=UPI0003822FE6|nr:hypothetical protein [Methylovulum miyakonense]